MSILQMKKWMPQSTTVEQVAIICAIFGSGPALKLLKEGPHTLKIS